MDLDLSQYRKIIALGVTGIVIMTLQWAGLDLQDLSKYGLNLTGVAEPITEFLVLYGLPAVFVTAQSNKLGESLLQHWRWVVVGLAILASLFGFVALVL
jgi:hypothetical protein